MSRPPTPRAGEVAAELESARSSVPSALESLLSGATGSAEGTAPAPPRCLRSDGLPPGKKKNRLPQYPREAQHTVSGGSAAEKKSLFDTLVGTLVETSEGGSAPPCGSNNNPALASLHARESSCLSCSSCSSCPSCFRLATRGYASLASPQAALPPRKSLYLTPWSER